MKKPKKIKENKYTDGPIEGVWATVRTLVMINAFDHEFLASLVAREVERIHEEQDLWDY